MKFLTDLNLVIGFISAVTGIFALVTDKIKSEKLRYGIVILLSLWLVISMLLQININTLFPSKNTALRINDIPSSIYSYQLTNTYTDTHSIFYVDNKGISGDDYKIEFNPTKGYSSELALAIGFNQNQNISIYRQLQFTIEFSTNNMVYKVYLKDSHGKEVFIDLNGSAPGIEKTNLSDKKRFFKIPLNENYKGIDLEEVVGVYFVTSTETGSGAEKDYFEVQDARFSND